MWPNPQELRIWSHLLKKSLMKNFIFCSVYELDTSRTSIIKWSIFTEFTEYSDTTKWHFLRALYWPKQLLVDKRSWKPKSKLLEIFKSYQKSQGKVKIIKYRYLSKKVTFANQPFPLHQGRREHHSDVPYWKIIKTYELNIT